MDARILASLLDDECRSPQSTAGFAIGQKLSETPPIRAANINSLGETCHEAGADFADLGKRLYGPPVGALCAQPHAGAGSARYRWLSDRPQAAVRLGAARHAGPRKRDRKPGDLCGPRADGQ